MNRSVVIHGHFYQPPREDPWLDDVPREVSAAPFHDWNQRIEQECYRAVVAARVPGADGRIARIVDALAWISFDAGPTLLEWMEREAPATYQAFLAADRASRGRCGYGNAIAMPYHHTILPLASRRDKATEIRWGLADFRRRFGRDAQGLWLPETAVDDETLDVLAAADVRFTVIAPHQVTRPPARGLPGLYRTGGGREIALFVYDGGIAHDIAFGSLLKDGGRLVERLLASPASAALPAVVAVATDGETYGHHHAFGEMALAAALVDLARRPEVRVENFAAVLARHPAREAVHLRAPSSWSCVHGVERWRADCGCKMAPHVPSQQRWRAHLRAALDWLAGELHAVFAAEGAGLLGNPWVARDDYGTVVAEPGEPMAQFVRAHRAGPAGAEADVRARELLEMERDALRMFTSCGWFFDDVAGLENRQILGYAARAIALSGAAAPRLEAGLLERLAAAESNDPAEGTAAAVYRRYAQHRLPASVRVAAGFAARRAVAPDVAVTSPRHLLAEQDSVVTVTDRRTGRTRTHAVRVARPTAGRVVVTVSDAGAEWVLEPSDLAERDAGAVRSALRGSLVEAWFTPEERRGVLVGDRSLAGTAARARVQAVQAVGVEGAGGGERIAALADLLDLLGHPVPFDAQTAFARYREGAGAEAQPALAAIGYRLGFTGAG